MDKVQNKYVRKIAALEEKLSDSQAIIEGLELFQTSLMNSSQSSQSNTAVLEEQKERWNQELQDLERIIYRQKAKWKKRQEEWKQKEREWKRHENEWKERDEEWKQKEGEWKRRREIETEELERNIRRKDGIIGKKEKEIQRLSGLVRSLEQETEIQKLDFDDLVIENKKLRNKMKDDTSEDIQVWIGRYYGSIDENKRLRETIEQMKSQKSVNSNEDKMAEMKKELLAKEHEIEKYKSNIKEIEKDTSNPKEIEKYKSNMKEIEKLNKDNEHLHKLLNKRLDQSKRVAKLKEEKQNLLNVIATISEQTSNNGKTNKNNLKLVNENKELRKLLIESQRTTKDYQASLKESNDSLRIENMKLQKEIKSLQNQLEWFRQRYTQSPIELSPTLSRTPNTLNRSLNDSLLQVLPGELII